MKIYMAVDFYALWILRPSLLSQSVSVRKGRVRIGIIWLFDVSIFKFLEATFFLFRSSQVFSLLQPTAIGSPNILLVFFHLQIPNSLIAVLNGSHSSNEIKKKSLKL